jgi:hypothetical protein
MIENQCLIFLRFIFFPVYLNKACPAGAAPPETPQFGFRLRIASRNEVI